MIRQEVPDGGEGASEGGRAIAWVWEPAPRVQKPHTQEIAIQKWGEGALGIIGNWRVYIGRGNQPER